MPPLFHFPFPDGSHFPTQQQVLLTEPAATEHGAQINKITRSRIVRWSLVLGRACGIADFNESQISSHPHRWSYSSPTYTKIRYGTVLLTLFIKQQLLCLRVMPINPINCTQIVKFVSGEMYACPPTPCYTQTITVFPQLKTFPSSWQPQFSNFHIPCPGVCRESGSLPTLVPCVCF